MNDLARGQVRPTKKCLSDIGLTFPVLTRALSDLDHPVVRKSQSVPDEVAAGGAERILSLTDRVWFKAKVQSFRAAVTRLNDADLERLELLSVYGEWWIGAAGQRRADSAVSDFYSRIAAEAVRAGRGSGRPDTDDLLPQEIDRERLVAELAALTYVKWQKIVRELLSRSLREGKPFAAEFSDYRVTAHIRASEGAEAYLAICSEGIWDADLIALILSCVPGIAADDWQPEPGGVWGIEPQMGQIIWSTIVPPDIQAILLEFDGND